MHQTITAAELRRLRRIHQQLADLQDRLARGPRQLNAGQTAVSRTEHEVVQLKDDWKKLRMQSDEQQLHLKQREAKLADLERKLNECKTNTEFKMLKDQIAAERQANAVLEDEILDKLERLEQLQVEIKQAEQRQVHTQEEFGKTQRRVEQEQGSLQSELGRVTDELEEAEKGLPAEFKAEYRRLVSSHGPEGLAPVDGETCGGCHTVLSAQTMNELYMSRIVFCKSCGCVLYLAEDRVRRSSE
jgi:predicted  nucleic acid-binding Zn-ribbon protein